MTEYVRTPWMLVLLLWGTAQFTFAQRPGGDGSDSYPSRPIRVIVPFGAGSITDVLTRSVMPKVSELLGQHIVVDNRPGFGGNLGTDLVVRANPDGHTLTLGAASTLAINGFLYRNMPYDPAKDLAPIALVATVPNILVVSPALPVRSVPELIAYAKANPGKLSYASTGAGGTVHLCAELFKALAGIQMEHILYKASPFAHVDLMANTVHVMFDGILTSLPQIRSGKLRALAVATPKRLPQVPDLPTVAEAGVPGYAATGWNGFAGPARLPGAIVGKLNREMASALNHPDVRKRLIALGAEPAGGSPQEFAAFLQSERSRWGKLIREINLRLD